VSVNDEIFTLTARHLMIVQARTVVTLRGKYFAHRRPWAVSCTWDHGQFNNALTTATLLLAASLWTLMSMWSHFAVGLISPLLINVRRTFMIRTVLTTTNLSAGVPTLAKVRLYPVIFAVQCVAVLYRNSLCKIVKNYSEELRTLHYITLELFRVA